MQLLFKILKGVDWHTAQEINTSHFIVERSGDGSSFVQIGTVAASRNRLSQDHYSFTDVTPLSDSNYYPIKIFDRDGDFTYSKIVTIVFQPSFLCCCFIKPCY